MTASVTLDTLHFKESPLSPWALGGRPRSSVQSAGGQRRRKLDPLPDAMPPALKSIFQTQLQSFCYFTIIFPPSIAPSEVVGCISYVNSYISESGLHRRNTLPPVIFDLFSPPPPASAAPDWPDWQGRGIGGAPASFPPDWREGESEEEEEESMSHRRGKPVKRKKLVKIEQQPDTRPTSVATSRVNRN